MKKLSKHQRKTLDCVIKYGLTKGFYLSGGTALLMKYDHRLSEDFDFFSFPEFSGEKFPLKRLLDTAKELGHILDYDQETLIILVDGVKFSFFSYPYKLLKPTENLPFNSHSMIFLASDEDIAASKLVAITQRGLKKDFFDLHFLCQKHDWNIKNILEFCSRKYDIRNDWMNIAIKALTYFDDAAKQIVMIEQKIPLDQTTWQKIKNYFEQQVKKFVFNKVTSA